MEKRADSADASVLFFAKKNIKLKHKNNYCLPQKIAEDGRKMALFRDLENK